MGCPDPPGNVHFFAGNAVPEPFARFIKRPVSGQPRHVRHAGIQIDRPHRVSDRFLLLPDRKMRLIIGIAQPVLTALFDLLRVLPVKIIGALSPLVHKIPAQRQIACISRRFIKTYQRHFRDLMSGIALALSFLRTKMRPDIICEPLRRL